MMTITDAYETLKAEQGGISSVYIADIHDKVGGRIEELQHFLIGQAGISQAQLGSDSRPPNEVSARILNAGIPNPHGEPLVTVILR